MAGVFRQLWRWQRGRQAAGYDKLLLAGLPWPLPCDGWLLRFPEGSEVPPHVDRVASGRHYRLNIILRSARSGGDFACARTLYATRHIKLFRPDLETHSVSRIASGSRWVLSIGWVRGSRDHASPAA